MYGLYISFARAAVAAAGFSLMASPVALASSSCSSQARSIKELRAEAVTLKADRDALLIEVEDAGDAWEDAEATRLFSQDHAARADLALDAYEDLKADLETLEGELQDTVSEVNSRVSYYNTACATRK